MPQVNLSINGRDYLLNCGEGQEERLHKVTAYINHKVSSLDRPTKQSGDTHLMLAAAMLAANEVLNLREEMKIMREAVEQSKKAQLEVIRKAHRDETEIIKSFTKIMDRIEQLANLMEERQEQVSFKTAG